MSKHMAANFYRELIQLFNLRTAWLLKVVGKGITITPKKVFDKRERIKWIDKLKKLAQNCVEGDYAKEEFNALIYKKKQWQCTRNKGWNRKDKKKHFDTWFARHIPYKNCIYIFWKGRKAEYVGRTLNGKGRPQSHFSTFWFNGITRIDIYSTSRASQVPKLECLAIHRFKPRRNEKNHQYPNGQRGAQCAIFTS